MSFPRYESYKDSGVEWLGNVPEHWDVKSVRHILRPSYDGLKIGPFGSQLTSQMLQEAGYKVYGQENVIANDFKRGERFIPEEKFQELVMYEICPGDILITMMGTSGRCGITPENIEAGIMDSHLLRMRVIAGVRPKFLQLLIDESAYVAQQIRVLGKGSIMHGLNSSIIKELVLTVPPVIEQDYLLSFLDRETTKIDALIAEQQRLIGLLKEKRQSVISHAVTKGLNPNAPMKDSGIEWLGEVPRHWEILQLGRICQQVSDGPHFSPNYVDDGVMFLSARNIKVDTWSLDDAKFISEEDYYEFCKRVIPEKGDILYTKGGTTDIARVVDLDNLFQVWVHVAVLKIHKEIAGPYFIAYELNSVGCYEQSQLYTRGASNNDLGLTRMIKIWLAFPPYHEQSTITAFLDSETSKLDTLTTEAKTAITLLQERRTALISAAVTGKIDVKNWRNYSV